MTETKNKIETNSEVSQLLPLLTRDQIKILGDEFDAQWIKEKGYSNIYSIPELQLREMLTARYNYLQQFEPVYPQTDYVDTAFYCRYCGKQTIVIDEFDDNYDYEEGQPEYCVSCVLMQEFKGF